MVAVRFVALAVARRAVLSPSTWFEVASLPAEAGALPLADSEGPGPPWTRIALNELRAVHRTLLSWHDRAVTRADADGEAALMHSIAAAVHSTRALLEARSAAVLGGADSRGDMLLAFPPRDHELLRDTDTALSLLHEFLPLRDAPSLLAWTRALTNAPDVVAHATRHAWVRMLLQKGAAERDLPEALDVMRGVYGDVGERERLRRDDRAAVAGAKLEWCGWWADALGLDAAPRSSSAIPTAPRRRSAAAARPDVTVLIPSYDHAAFIEGTINSVLGQSHTALRALVVDDHSTDDTAARARAIDDPRLHVDVNSRNLGLGDSVLAALERVQTPFVALLNSDDIFHPERLARCLDAFARTPAAQVVATGVVPIDAAGARLTPATVSHLLDGPHIADWVRWHADRCQVPEHADVLAELLERNFLISSSNIVARTDFLRQLAPDLRGLQYCLDWQVFLAAALDRALVVVREDLLGYRLHATNTVWFDDARAVSYRVEVNRVLLSALKGVAARSAGGPPDVAAGLERLVRHAARHSEASGFAMAAVDLWGGDVLESQRADSASVHDLLRDLTRPADAHASAGETPRQAARSLAAQVQAEMAREARDEAEHGRAAAEQAQQAAARSRDAAEEARVEAEQARIQAEQARTHADEARRQAEAAQAQADDARARSDEMRTASEHARDDADRARLAAEQDAQALHVRLHEQSQVTDGLRQAVAEAGAANDVLRDARDAAHVELDARAQALDELRRQHDESTRAGEHALARAGEALDQARRDAAAQSTAQAAAHAAAVAQLRSAPEWLLGDRLWNGARLSRVGEPSVRALHRWRNRRNRWGLALRGLARTAGVARPGAIVTACWSFPIHSQTFVYQEMTALAWTGLETRVFCCDTNPKSELPAAFAGLWPKRLVMQTDWAAGQADLAHFRRTRPARVEALLAHLAAATGCSAEALLQESIVLTGFTFARHVELARASYLHTYFFYDQSFLALMAAFLLDLPRGITAYADHMLGDYAFKLVPLHLQLADIVVATSARIKEELVALGGDAARIIVKPNGIDVARFPYVPAAARLAHDGPPELVAVQRIEPKKGLIHLVEAMALLRDRGVEARLNVVGGVDVNTPTSAACHRELVERIGALHLGDAVVLHGSMQQHEFAPIAARSRLFVAPYVETGTGDKDGIPTAVLEAMSTGLPIVATDAGSIAEAARDGVEAICVPQRDAAALADAIATLLTDREAWTRMSDAARARAVDAFDIHVTETRLHERIRATLAEARG